MELLSTPQLSPVEIKIKIKVKDVVKFILRHRRGTPAFPNYSMAQLVEEVRTRMECGTIHVICTAHGIAGVVFAHVEWLGATPQLHIENILCSAAGTFRAFRQLARQRFPGIALFGFRNGRLKLYKK